MPEDILEPQFTTNYSGEFSVDMLNRCIDVANKLYISSNIVPHIISVVDTRKIKKISEVEKYSKTFHSMLFSTSGIATSSHETEQGRVNTKEFDIYRYASSAMLAETTNAVKKILPNSKSVNNTSLIVTTPHNLEDRLGVDKQEAGDPYLLVRRSAEQLIQGIETELSLINTYYSVYEQRLNPSAGLEHFVNNKLIKIRNYAKDAGMIVPILEDFSFYTEAGALKETIRMLNKENLLEEAIKKDKIYHVIRNIFSTQALLLGEKFSGNPYTFLDSTGEEICLSMILAKNIRDAMNTVLHVTAKNQLDKEKHLVAAEEKYIKINDANIIREQYKDNYGDAVAGLTSIVLNDMHFMIKVSSNPFYNLASKMEPLGIPFEVAKTVEERLSLIKTKRSYPDQIDGLSFKEACNLVLGGDKTFISGIREIVNQTTGIKPKQTAYLSHNNIESIFWAPGISSLAYVTSLDSNRDIKVYREFSTKEDEILLMRKLSAFYPDYDSYARMNTGACFLFNFNHLDSIINNFNPIIDIRDLSSYFQDIQAGKDLHMHVALHEMEHNAQIGSRIIWRHLVTAVLDWACKNAIIHLEDDNYTKPMSFRANSRTIGIKSWKDTFIDATAAYCIPALAVGRIGEKYRNESFFVTAMSRGFDPLDDKNLDFNYNLLYKVKTEESSTQKLFQETLDVLKHDSIELLRQQLNKIQDREQELLSIIEHMAESFSLYASKIVLQTTAQNDAQKADAIRRYDLIKRNIVGRGEWAKVYQDILKSTDDRNFAEALRERGMKYHRATSRTQTDTIENTIAKLGFNSYEPNDAYHNMALLEDRAKSAGLNINKLLMPMNGARALLGLRYSTQVDTYLDVIDIYGSKNAFKLILNCETFDEVKGLLKDKK